MNDLDTLFPADNTIVVNLTGGITETITAKEFTFGQLPQVMKLSQAIYGQVSDLTGSTNQEQLISDIMIKGGDDFMRLLGLSINRDREWFDRLQIDSAIDVVRAVLEVNMSFFVQKVLPKFKVAMKSLAEATDSSSLRSSTRV